MKYFKDYLNSKKSGRLIGRIPRHRHLPLTNHIPIRQRVRFLRYQLMFHKGTKAWNVAGGGRIVSDDQQRFAGLHVAHGFAHHHYRLRAAEALGVKGMVWAGKQVGHDLLDDNKSAVVYAPLTSKQTRLTIA